MNKTLLLAFLLSCLNTSSYAARYYVSASATGSGTGLTWTDAMPDLQSALSIAFYGDEIWVAAGQYKPTNGTDRNVSFEIRDGVNILGSFAGTETAVDQRDVLMNPSTLNGDIGNVGSSSDNSYHVVRGDNITTIVIFDGFRIINGNSNSRGGGMFVEDNLGGELIIRNCFFFGNEANNYGGAIDMSSSNVTLERCDFVNNTASNGGAISNNNNNGGFSTLIMRDCIFKGNSAHIGGVIRNTLKYQSLIIDRCIFTNNTSDTRVIEVDNFVDKFVLKNSLIAGNWVDDTTSEIMYLDLFDTTSAVGEITNCTFAHNINTAGTNGNAMFQFRSAGYKISNSVIFGNTPQFGLQLDEVATVSDCIIEGGYTNGTNVMDVDPLFVMPNASATSGFDVSAYDYALQSSSPAVNVGNNARMDTTLYPLDLASAMRIQSLAVDLGCYESSFSVSVASHESGSQTKPYFDVANNMLVFPPQLLNGPFRIFDTTGKLVSSDEASSTNVPVSLTRGVYVLYMNDGSSLKFVISAE